MDGNVLNFFKCCAPNDHHECHAARRGGFNDTVMGFQLRSPSWCCADHNVFRHAASVLNGEYHRSALRDIDAILGFCDLHVKPHLGHTSSRWLSVGFASRAAPTSAHLYDLRADIQQTNIGQIDMFNPSDHYQFWLLGFFKFSF
jgi:hypothetical protein